MTKALIEAAIYGFEAQRKEIDAQIAELRGLLTGTPQNGKGESPAKTPRRKFSAAARKRMQEAQRARWAKLREKSPAPAKAAAKKTKSKRGLTAEGRKALSVAMKKRWAAKKAAAA
ncbi:MAG TPA: hypothetical protein VMU80_08255 [Bryobacteraceae bacterium]|nr:hypothetical protein [Bryobacteraceae bacterium]